MAQSKTSIPSILKTMRKLEQGQYTATDVRWGMALDLSGADNRSLIAYGFHGLENQQVRSFWFLAVRDRFRNPLIDPTGIANFTVCSGSSVPAVQVSSSTASGAALARSSPFGT
jgi:hypothetical protein